MRKPISLLGLLFAGFLTLAGCQTQPAKSPDVKDSVRIALDQAGLRDVSVSQDRDKGVVTLTGTVASDSERTQAGSIAASIANGQVIANQVGVRPPGAESTAKDVDSALDKGIEKNLDALFLQHKWNHAISYDVKNGVVTLKGETASQSRRNLIEKSTAAVPNVRQVVNEIDVPKQKASTSY